jgi:hypothetical protein
MINVVCDLSNITKGNIIKKSFTIKMNKSLQILNFVTLLRNVVPTIMHSINFLMDWTNSIIMKSRST